jgi:hypothetical protein
MTIDKFFQYTLPAVIGFCLMSMLLLLTGCNDDKPSYPNWVSVPAGWEFYAGTSAEPHYVVKRVSSLSGSIRIKYRVDGVGVRALDGGTPPTVTLILWRANDAMTCAGEYQQYRYFGHPRMALEPAGIYEYEIKLDPENWTDCYAKPGTDFPDRFKGTIDNIWKVGFGFGGHFAGHGAVSTGAKFTLLEFSP